ncbi:hypothetical protein [Variovorax sp. YR216]|uniref:hypothetical protein n=1 Tax=Variovorax sp. YR216 TaxID=1882828 RepID=UPI000899479D|nr:hypothetical protein [Variovorax sp. YR216]SEA76342.1 hypothetical protein SAMN05444680_103476 [Variovorax sp. YR216]
MTIKTFAALTLALASTLASAQTATYAKRGAQAEITRSGDTAAFTLVSTAGQSRCELEGTAQAVDQDRFAWTDGAATDRCVAVLNLKGGKLAVTTKGCAGYCGAGAETSMDGSYSKK